MWIVEKKKYRPEIGGKYMLSFPTPALSGSGLVVGTYPSQPLLRLPHEYLFVKGLYHFEKHLSNSYIEG